jgi:ankyrin repeat protein
LYNSSFETPFIIASAMKNIPVMKLLIEYGGDSLRSDFKQINIAFIAAFRPRPSHLGPNELIRGVTAFRSRVSIPEAGLGVSSLPLNPLLADLTFELVPLFLSFPTVNVNFFYGGETILIVAARTRNYQLMREVLNMPNVNPDVYDYSGNTALLFCADSGNLDGVRLLVNEGHANLHAKNFHGATAFSLAVSHGYKDILQFLLSHPSFNPARSSLALSLIVGDPDRADLISMFIHLDFDINQMVENWNAHNMTRKLITPLLWATARNAVNLFGQIIIHPRFNAEKSWVDRAIFAAVRSVNTGLFNILLQLLGPNINIRNRHNETLLTYACLRGKIGRAHV